MTTVLQETDVLPLTCTREGTCCHGKQVWVNPWELAVLAQARGASSRSTRDALLTDGGIRLRMEGPTFHGRPGCVLYQSGKGCTAHPGRPLACRLYPLGRRLDGTGVTWLHEGREFPCRAECPGVDALPTMTVHEYVRGQDITAGVAAQEALREVVADLAEGAFTVLIDGGGARDRRWQNAWETMTKAPAAGRATRLGPAWIDALTVPPIDGSLVDEPAAFVGALRDHLQTLGNQAAQEQTGRAQASTLLIGAALHLAQSLGGEVPALAQTWMRQAKRLAS